MRTLGRNPTEDEIMNIMNEIDVDHNGKLDFSEFTIMMKDKLSGEDMEQEIKQAFRYSDPNLNIFKKIKIRNEVDNLEFRFQYFKNCISTDLPLSFY